MSQISLSPLTPSIGAELSGIDLSKHLKNYEYDQIYDALINYQVIFLRDQSVCPEKFLKFAEEFGDIDEPHPIYSKVRGFPQLVCLENGPDNPPDTDTWHTDETFKANPPFASLLLGMTIPKVGGDTIWSSMIAAYEALPPDIKNHIQNLRAIHDMSDFRNNFTVGEPIGAAKKLNSAHSRIGSAIHPLVLKHPSNGKNFLFANPGFTIQIVGMNSNDSRNLLNLLFNHITRPEFQVRYKWTQNSIAMWDNRCTMHYAVNDYMPNNRKMYRITIKADRRSKK